MGKFFSQIKLKKIFLVHSIKLKYIIRACNFYMSCDYHIYF